MMNEYMLRNKTLKLGGEKQNAEEVRFNYGIV